jgi:hypothetical protein
MLGSILKVGFSNLAPHLDCSLLLLLRNSRIKFQCICLLTKYISHEELHVLLKPFFGGKKGCSLIISFFESGIYN